MRSVVFVMLILGLALPASAARPPVPDGSVFAVEVTLSKQLKGRGHGFLLQRPDGSVLATALHLLDAGTLQAHELGGPIAVTASEAWSKRRAFVATTPVVTPHSAPDDNATDVMLFEVPTNKKGRIKSRTPTQALVLGSACPAAGDRVWVASSLAGDRRAREATVLRCDARSLEFEMAQPLDFGSIAGAPVLDGAGYVVSMLVAGSKPSGPQLLGAGPSVAALGAHLSGGELVPRAERPLEPAVVAGLPVRGEDPWTNTAGLDLEELFVRLLPAWGLYGTGEEAITALLEADPALRSIFGEISKLSWESTMGNFRKISAEVERFEARLAELGSPLTLRPFGAGQQLAILTSWRMYEGPIRVGEREVPVELSVRLDGLNVVEGLMAFGVDGGVLVSAAAAMDAVDEAVLPALREGSRSAALNAELAEVLGPEGAAALAQHPPGPQAYARLALHVAALAAEAAAVFQATDPQNPAAPWLALVAQAPQLGAVLACWHGDQGYFGAAGAAKTLGLCSGSADHSDDALEKLGDVPRVDLGAFPRALPLGPIQSRRPKPG